MYFHVINGTHQGAELTLELNKNYTVANNLNADIYLEQTQDISFAFQILEGNNLILTDTNVDLKNLSTNKNIDVNNPINTPLFISVNDTIIAISPNPNQELPENVLDCLNQTTEDINGINGDEQQFVEDIQHARHYTQFKLKFNKFLKATTSAITLLWHNLYTKYGKKLYIAIGVLLIIIATVIFSIHELNLEQATENTNSSSILNKDLFNKKLATLPSIYANLKSKTFHNSIILYGVLENRNQLTTLTGLLKGFHYTNKILIFSEMKNTISGLLAQWHILHPNITYSPNNGIVISGITDNLENVNNFEIDMVNKFNNYNNVDVDNIYLSKDIDDFLTKITSGLSEQISVNTNYTQGIININGYLSQTQESILVTQVNTFNQQHNNVVTIKLNLQQIDKAIPFAVKEVYTGDSPWLVTDNGTKLYVGGVYNGVTIVSIQPSKIVFKGKFLFTIPLNDLINLNNSHGDVAVNSNCNQRGCILQQEKSKELQVIAKEQKQLQDLQLILQNNHNPKLAEALSDTINNISNDLTSRQKELTTLTGRDNS